MQQEALQRLQRAQRARDVLVSIARSRTFLHPHTAHGPHSSYSCARMPYIPLQSKRAATALDPTAARMSATKAVPWFTTLEHSVRDCGPQVKPSILPPHAYPQVQGLKCTMAKKPTSKKPEQALRRRARGAIYSLPHTLPLPSCLVPLPIPTLLPSRRHDFYRTTGSEGLRPAQQARHV